MERVLWVDPRAVREELSVEDPADVRSHEFLRFVMRVCESLDVDIPRQDYERLITLDGSIEYLASLAPQRGALAVT